MPTRRHLLAHAAAAMLPALLPLSSLAASKNSLTLGMALEPPVLDPTASAAAAIGEIVHYNLFETLVKITPQGTIAPLLAQRWEVAPDWKTITFHLRQDAQFHNGVPLTADSVKFSFDRAASSASTNKDKALFAQLTVSTPDRYTVVVASAHSNPDLLFALGQATAIIVEPGSAATNASAPVGTGPYRVQQWQKGSRLTLLAWPQWREAGRIALQRVTFRFIPDAAAQATALLAGDVDVFPRIGARSVEQFQNDPRFQVIVSGSRAKTIVSVNNARPPLNDVRVRRALAAAIDRQAVITGAADGFGVPIGSHYTPGAPGYIDTTGINPFDPEKARQLLKEAGVAQPLKLQMTLPPTPYARQGGEIIAAQLAQVGVQVQLVNVEWAQWLSQTYGAKQYDLTLISHVEPLDLGNYAKADYYWNYRSSAFDQLYQRIQTSTDPEERNQHLAAAQRLLAQDCVNLFLYQPQWVTIAKTGLRGLWNDMPIAVNDLSGLAWG
ncbi:ABC transporter substrate-binding protein [Comamonas nitrativorans]|uniref:ABC transporter substrate-binding protein n=1 Tax=Comamonas nitrativorans TaxID=108437 RepID=A0ABV9GYJ0_9BURK